MSFEDDNQNVMQRPQLAVLQAARAWRIVHHRLFQLDPDRADQVFIAQKGFTVWDLYFLQDLLLVENASDNLLLDVGWYPHADPGGSFKLLVVRKIPGSDAEEPSYDWDHPLKDVVTRSIDELLSSIHGVLRESE